LGDETPLICVLFDSVEYVLIHKRKQKEDGGNGTFVASTCPLHVLPSCQPEEVKGVGWMGERAGVLQPA